MHVPALATPWEPWVACGPAAHGHLEGVPAAPGAAAVDGVGQPDHRRARNDVPDDAAQAERRPWSEFSFEFKVKEVVAVISPLEYLEAR